MFQIAPCADTFGLGRLLPRLLSFSLKLCESRGLSHTTCWSLPPTGRFTHQQQENAWSPCQLFPLPSLADGSRVLFLPFPSERVARASGSLSSPAPLPCFPDDCSNKPAAHSLCSVLSPLPPCFLCLFVASSCSSSPPPPPR